MLFKFGPPGSAYGTQENLGKDDDGNPVTQPNLLAQVTHGDRAGPHARRVTPSR